MRLKGILMMLLISGLINSCGHTSIDYKNIEDHVYINETEYPITIQGYSEQYDSHELLWIIEPDSHIDIQIDLGGEFKVSPQICEYIVITFNGLRELAIQQGESCLAYSDKQIVTKRHTRYYHRITSAMYMKATEIK